MIKDDALIYEHYFNGYQRDSIATSFSMAKSFDLTLVGIAIDEGEVTPTPSLSIRPSWQNAI